MIARRRHVAVVTRIMFDPEVTKEGWCEHEKGNSFADPVRLMTRLMSSVSREGQVPAMIDTEPDISPDQPVE